VNAVLSDVAADPNSFAFNHTEWELFSCLPHPNIGAMLSNT
jgi:hypothetical protein